MSSRVGFGFDVHRISEGRSCILGGIHIPHHSGPEGHSDADVLIHAICDALLGAAGLRDIGFHFPDTDPAFKNADSRNLLEKVVELVTRKGYRIGNIDSTVVLEEPKINPFIDAMKSELAKVMGILPDAIGIKATTNESMGFIGRGEGATAYAVALIETL